MGDRASLISSAVSFLRDPSTASSPLAQRIAFLESKGLNQQEIEQALQAANGGPLVMSSHGNAGMGMRGARAGQREFERDWRDWFIMSVVGGGVGWLAVKLAQKFLLPSLQPPSESDLVASQKALEAKYDEAASLLSTLQKSTDQVFDSLDQQRETVERELDEVKKVVEEMREGERRRDEWSKGVQRQVDEMAKNLPTLLEKHSSTQSTSLNDLQSELKSLKSLLIARRPTPSSPSSSSSSTTPTTSSSSLFGGQPRTPSLPAWQMKGSTASSLATPSSTTTSGYTVPSSASPSSTVQPEDPSASGVLVEKPDETQGTEEKKETGAATTTNESETK
ncbi:peroxisomal membrane protein PEX14 [Sporobolomyces salmoneus]|uniref:peroxisomal membrane protein PEX14 n=1 Tax=Sporobolomyces salmoneus TaxID=183962 RepID=UPI003171332A